MKKKKLLIISQFFYPEQFPINLLASNLRKFNYKLSVITGYPTYPKFIKYKKYFKFFPSKSNYNNMKIFRIPIFPRINNSSLVLIFNYLSFILSGFIFSFFILFKKKIDYIFVYATSPLLQALVGVFLKKIKKTKLIIWVQDLWPESLEYTGYIKNRLVLFLVKKIVIYIYNQADLILAQSEKFKKNIKKITNSKVLVLYNPSKDFFMKNNTYIDKKKLKFVYAGNIGKVQSIQNIVEVANQFKKQKNLTFEIIGSGSEYDKIKKLIKKKKLNNILLKNQKNYIEIKKEFQKSDILVVLLKKHKLSEITIPSKIQAYMSTGKPILCCMDGEAKRILKEANCGFACKNDVESIKKMILKISKLKGNKLKKIGNNGRKFFLENFALDVVTFKTHKILQNIND